MSRAVRYRMASAQTVQTSSIEYGGVSYDSAVCDQCGGKVHPASALDAHKDRHELRHLRYQGQIKLLKQSLDRMR